MNGPTLGAVFPSDIDELTPAILGAALADRHPGVVVDYVEIQAPSSASGRKYWVDAEWARRFPAEQAWILAKR